MRPDWKAIMLLLFLPVWAVVAIELSHFVPLASAVYGLVVIGLNGSIVMLALLELVSGLLFIKRLRANNPLGRLPKGAVSYLVFFIWTSGGGLVLQGGLLTNVISHEWEWGALAVVLVIAMLCLSILITGLVRSGAINSSERS